MLTGVSDMTLGDRKKNILESIIKDYVETAEPVGSRAVVKKHDLKISAATVRNEMADLEEMGYLEQLHTSSGRIPSQQGFRYFVDCMMEKEDLNEEESDLLSRILAENINDWGEVVEKVGHFLAQLTNYTSFIIMPAIQMNQFKHIQILPIEEQKALVIVVTDSGLIMHRKIDIPNSVNPDELYNISKVFNKVFSKRNFKEMKRTDLSYLREKLTHRRNMIDKVIDAIDHLLTGSNDEKVIISGALNILNEPEFKDVEKLKGILAFLEEDGVLKNIIPAHAGEEVDITIGSENTAAEIKEMSIVLSGFKTFGQMGRIGVIGPVRMEYWKAAGTVEALSKTIEDVIKQKF